MKLEQYNIVLDHIRKRYGVNTDLRYVLDNGHNVIGQSSIVSPQVIVVTDSLKNHTYIELERLIAISTASS